MHIYLAGGTTIKGHTGPNNELIYRIKNIDIHKTVNPGSLVSCKGLRNLKVIDLMKLFTVCNN